MSRIQSERGYWRIFDDVFTQTVVWEHRLVVEIFIGRQLRKGEVVHHLDLRPANNSISNLVLLASGEHHQLHALILDRPWEANLIAARGRRNMLEERRRNGAITPASAHLLALLDDARQLLPTHVRRAA